LFGLVAGRLDVRVAGDLQRLPTHRAAKALAQQTVEHFGADLRPETLLDDLGRNLAGAEALDACATRDFTQTSTHFALEPVGRRVEGAAAFKGTERFDRNLQIHACHRGEHRRHVDLLLGQAAATGSGPPLVNAIVWRIPPVAASLFRPRRDSDPAAGQPGW